ncbi:MAG: sulfotransferase [Roseimicrobium sp.]
MKPRHLSQQDQIRLRHVRVAGQRPDLAQFPDFLIVGPQRTGTTWLYHNLKCHPEILLPAKKEIYYFSTLGHPEHRRYQFQFLEDYMRIFDTSLAYRLNRHYDALRRCGCLYHPRVRGEATATYATLETDVIEEIAVLNPAVKAIVMVRHPVERALSHAKKELLRKASGPVSDDELLHFCQSQSKIELCDYDAILAAWRAHLRPGHVFVGDYREIVESPLALLAAMHRFLGVLPGERYVKTRHVRETINATLKRPISDELRAKISDLLHDEVAAYLRLSESIAEARVKGSANPEGAAVVVG